MYKSVNPDHINSAAITPLHKEKNNSVPSKIKYICLFTVNNKNVVTNEGTIPFTCKVRVTMDEYLLR